MKMRTLIALFVILAGCAVEDKSTNELDSSWDEIQNKWTCTASHEWTDHLGNGTDRVLMDTDVRWELGISGNFTITASTDIGDFGEYCEMERSGRSFFDNPINTTLNGREVQVLAESQGSGSMECSPMGSSAEADLVAEEFDFRFQPLPKVERPLSRSRILLYRYADDASGQVYLRNDGLVESRPAQCHQGCDIVNDPGCIKR